MFYKTAKKVCLDISNSPSLYILESITDDPTTHRSIAKFLLRHHVNHPTSLSAHHLGLHTRNLSLPRSADFLVFNIYTSPYGLATVFSVSLE